MLTTLAPRPVAAMTAAAPARAGGLLDDLLQGTDTRARSPYGLALPASDALVHFGSCTANPITPEVMSRHRALTERGAWSDPQAALQALFGAEHCVLADSGTDAEYLCALAMGSAEYVSVLMDPLEIGGGCVRAAAGLAHAAGCPVDKPLPIRAIIETTQLRDAHGEAIAQADVDVQVLSLLQRHADKPVLLHHVPCSKTGLSAPSEAACLHLQRYHPAGVRVVVDASQGRFASDDVRRWLGHGWAVIITGSKYFGAPPFCGAVLFPAAWPVVQGFPVGPGLLARWRLALDTMMAPRASHDAWLQVLSAGFLRGLPPGIRIDGGEAPSRQGILSFDAGLDMVQSQRLHRALIQRGFFIGQPVSAGSRALLRVALSARTPLHHALTDLERLARTLSQELQHG